MREDGAAAKNLMKARKHQDLLMRLLRAWFSDPMATMRASPKMRMGANKRLTLVSATTYAGFKNMRFMRFMHAGLGGHPKGAVCGVGYPRAKRAQSMFGFNSIILYPKGQGPDRRCENSLRVRDD